MYNVVAGETDRTYQRSGWFESDIDLLDLSTHAEIAVTWDDDNLKEYSRKCHRGCDNLQLLKEYVHTPLQKKHIDSLCLLLWNKELLLSKAMHTFEELQGIGDIVQESIPSIVSIARKQAVLWSSWQPKRCGAL